MEIFYNNKNRFLVASERGDFDTMKIELERGVDVNVSNIGGDTALHFAATKRWMPIVEFLLKRGANPNAMNFQDQTPLHKAVAEGDKEITRLLLEHGADPQLMGALKHDAFYTAHFHHRDDSELKELLQSYVPREVEKPEGFLARFRRARSNPGQLPDR